MTKDAIMASFPKSDLSWALKEAILRLSFPIKPPEQPDAHLPRDLKQQEEPNNQNLGCNAP